MYTDKELHQMCDKAMKRKDDVLAAAILAVGIAHEQGKDRALLEYLLMWCNFQQEHKGGQHDTRPDDITALDPNAVISL